MKLNWRVWKKLWDFNGNSGEQVGWRLAVERARAFRVQLTTEGYVVFACVSGRTAPASARLRLVRAARNMVVVGKEEIGVYIGKG